MYAVPHPFLFFSVCFFFFFFIYTLQEQKQVQVCHEKIRRFAKVSIYLSKARLHTRASQASPALRRPSPEGADAGELQIVGGRLLPAGQHHLLPHTASSSEVTEEAPS